MKFTIYPCKSYAGFKLILTVLVTLLTGDLAASVFALDFPAFQTWSRKPVFLWSELTKPLFGQSLIGGMIKLGGLLAGKNRDSHGE
ncbi:MAG: hypothetical protein ABDI20_02100 [Candidatus Bipolaricaulaceae bacterium]